MNHAARYLAIGVVLAATLYGATALASGFCSFSLIWDGDANGGQGGWIFEYLYCDPFVDVDCEGACDAEEFVCVAQCPSGDTA